RTLTSWSNSFTNQLGTGATTLHTAVRIVDATGTFEATKAWSGGSSIAVGAIAAFTAAPSSVSYSPITVGTEYDIAMTTDGSQLTLWVDDVAVDSATFTDDI